MNLYTAADHAKAETVLATAWAKSAYAEGHRARLPKSPQEEKPKRVYNSSRGQSLREMAFGLIGTDWISSRLIASEMSSRGMTKGQIHGALRDLVTIGCIEMRFHGGRLASDYRRTGLPFNPRFSPSRGAQQ